MRTLLTILFLGCISTFANKTSAEIYHSLEKVHALKRVLYLAAHPDDENTRALAWFSLEQKAETAYLSLTRGDGGQNLIGDELSESLGVLRTQELLAARSHDQARQFFTRAVDFGYSKTADETLAKWGKDEILSDVVRVIRKFKPEVIITRFPPDKRGGHGHHTASAMLAIEAFSKAADPNYEPDQVKAFGVWQTEAVYWNTSIWWDKELDKKAEGNDGYIVKDIGGYDPLLGMSYNEIGTVARSQHKCQGFGAVLERGSRIEYFEHLAGNKFEADFFENNNRSWSTLISSEFEKAFNEVLTTFDFKEPSNNVPKLVSLRNQLASISGTPFDGIRDEKIEQLNDVIIDCLGLHIHLLTDDYAYVKGEDIVVNIEAINRSELSITIVAIDDKEIALKLNQNEVIEHQLKRTNKAKLSTPYWLANEFDMLFQVPSKDYIGDAENAPTFSSKIRLSIEGKELDIDVPVIKKWRDPSYGERQRETISAPQFSVNFDQPTAILKEGTETTVRLKVHAFQDQLNEVINLKAPSGWNVNPAKLEFKNLNKHQEVWFEVQLKPTANAINGDLEILTVSDENTFAFHEITYDHIPTQVIFKPTKLRCVALDAKIIPGKVAYIKGAGDAVATAIEQLGFEVSLFEVDDLASLDLSGYQTVVMGIRIYNVYPELRNFESKLEAYVKNGGNLIMQYNTASRSGGNEYGPIPFSVTRNRVTEEDAEVTFLAPKHELLNKPNKISPADFEDWVQERGLYFAGDWDERFEPILSWYDKGEEPQSGALIVAKHGKGRFMYTGISFFRELPNGVEGAYRLFANLLSY
ncbi:MAG: PIG-L family deacetylase [Crocinitomicaceae bacterium]